MAEQNFLTEEQEEQVVDAIQRTEKVTSGEVRVHIEHTCEDDALDRAKELFKEMDMHETELKNGVLVYVASDDHKVAVFGGKGIHEKVGQNFWDDVIKLMISHFKQDEFEAGLVKAVDRIGEKLSSYFPYQKDDVNELPDEISYNPNIDDTNDDED